MTNNESFSKRHGHIPVEREITIRDAVPAKFRESLLWIAVNKCGLERSTVLDIVRDVLRIWDDDGVEHTSDPSELDKLRMLITECEWFRVYDIAEAIYSHLHAEFRTVTDLMGTRREQTWRHLEDEVNASLRELGIGWQMKDGLIQTRANDAFEATVTAATSALQEAALPTAESELKEALHDLSRRPEPDLSGAITHAMGALECVARQVTGDPKSTLGHILKKHPGLLPKPLDSAAQKVWGYSSEMARHVREGRALSWEDAQVVVGLCAVLSTHLASALKR